MPRKRPSKQRVEGLVSSRTLSLLALLGYPVLILVSLWLDRPELRALSMPLLAVALVGGWPASTGGRALVLSSVALAAIVIAAPALALWPPGLACLAVAAFFALSLRPGRQPLIERFAQAVHRDQGLPMPGNSEAWMQRWTALWAILLAVIGAVTLTLAIVDRPVAWLVWVVLIGPLLGLAGLIAEYLLRRRHFPEIEHWTLGRFLVLLTRVRPKQLVR